MEVTYRNETTVEVLLTSFKLKSEKFHDLERELKARKETISRYMDHSRL
jgi:hypothetical protein